MQQELKEDKCNYHQPITTNFNWPQHFIKQNKNFNKKENRENTGE
jgi:hypothetical protein